MGTSARRLQVPVVRRLGDQIMGHSRDVDLTLVKMFFKFNSRGAKSSVNSLWFKK